MRLRSLILLLFTLSFACAQSIKLNDALIHNRYPFSLTASGLTGPGSALLSRALTGANFVLIGEDHGMSEVPLFVEGVWKLCTPLGFDTMAVESGPLAVDELRAPFASQQGRAYVASIEKQAPTALRSTTSNRSSISWPGVSQPSPKDASACGG